MKSLSRLAESFYEKIKMKSMVKNQYKSMQIISKDTN